MATLRISGIHLDVDAFLQAVPLEPTAIRRKGEPRSFSRPDGPRNTFSNINVGVSEAAFTEVDAQLGDARRFLTQHAEALSAARSFAGVERLQLDFPIQDRDVAAQTDIFPAELLAEMGRLGIDLAVSRYPAPASE